jgi:hypothetical protein
MASDAAVRRRALHLNVPFFTADRCRELFVTGM